MTTGDTETTAATRPLTGDEYLESIRDGREIWLNGERVDDVTTHPAFRNSARSIARLYDALHDPAHAGRLLAPCDGAPGATHAFFVAPRSTEELVAGRDAIVEWQRLVYGFMGRSPDYKASFTATLGANADFYEPYGDNARRWYDEAQRNALYMNHALVNPPIDRSLSPEEIGDVPIHVVQETDSGLIVSGAKVVATGSALTHANFIAHYGLPVRTKEYAVMFTVPMDAPGVKLISRVSYELQAATLGSPFDYPLSSRFDENDAILVMERVLVPWENVFVYGDADKVNTWAPATGVSSRMFLHGCTRLAVKLDFITGLLLKAVALTGTKDFRGVQVKVGEVVGWRNLFWGLSDAMVRSSVPSTAGTVVPNEQYGMAFRIFATEAYPAIKAIVQKAVGSGLIYLNSNAADFKREELRGVLDKYVRGSGGVEAVDRVKLMKLLWDAVGSEFGGRHELYERNYLGNDENVRLETLMAAEMTGTADAFRGFADQCMSEYDLDGWTVPGYIDPGDVSVIGRGG
jgi:4-hydroxyphenylacetate 3-monooxygenase